jgi:DNA polymerase-1
VAAERDELYLIDGSGYLFRAFFALPPLSNSRGLPTNAIYGFVRMLLKLLKDARPTHIAVAFDSEKKTFRDDLFVDYKANRPPMPNDLAAQIPYIHRAVEALRIRKLIRDGFEADDLIGTLAVRAARAGFEVVVATADKDFMQLVGPHISLVDSMRDKHTTVKEIRERFGVEPHQLIDIMALTGDAIDNVKGVPGIGEKTASALIQKFGSLEEIYRDLSRVEQTDIRGAKKVAQLLAGHRADAELARKLVTIDTGAPVEFEPHQLDWPGIDKDAVANLLRELEFHSMLAELAPSQANLFEPQEVPAAARASEADVPRIIEELRASTRICFDLSELEDDKKVLKIKGDAATHVVDEEHIPRLAPVLCAQSPPKSCHDLKHHIGALKTLGVTLCGVDFDTMLAGFLVNSSRAEPTLGELYREHLAPLGGRGVNASEPELIAALRDVLMPRLEHDGLLPLFNEIEMPMAPVLAEMEAAGIGVDAVALRQISTEFAEQTARLERECYELAGREFNLNSPTQLRDLLFDHLKLSVKGLKKTKSGFSTDADTLEKLSSSHPLPAKLLEYRAISKLKSTYTDALEQLIDPATGRVHTTFHQALTATGRLSSSDPNLQNIPARSEEGRRIRRAFVPKPGCVFLSADYSQIDLRVLAHLSGDATLVDAFQRGEDIHVRTATELLGVSADHVDANARRMAKTINFGIIYGMGPQRLAASLGIPLKDAADYIKRYFERLPGVRAFMDDTVREARERGYVVTMYGRRRYLPELQGPAGAGRAQAERIAVNTPIQGSAADLIKVAMIRLYDEFKSGKMDARMLLQVHDELLFEVPVGELDAAAEAARRQMEGVGELKVPLRVDLKSGPNWAQLEGRD